MIELETPVNSQDYKDHVKKYIVDWNKLKTHVFAFVIRFEEK